MPFDKGFVKFLAEFTFDCSFVLIILVQIIVTFSKLLITCEMIIVIVFVTETYNE